MPREIRLESLVASPACEREDNANNLDGEDFGKIFPHPANGTATSPSNAVRINRFTCRRDFPDYRI